MENVYIMNHPLIQHKISMLRNKNTGTNEFRKLVEEIGILMGYEALRDLPVENVEVETPIETCMTPMIVRKEAGGYPCAPRRPWNGKQYSHTCAICKSRPCRTLS